MCGIIGRFAYAEALTNADVLRSLVDTLGHRGPDGAACWFDGPFFLGHRRLAIIDLSPSGAQPMCTADGSLVVTFNGEIYNYLELREELVSRGYQFRTQSDTEVLLHGYTEWRDELPARLVGMFAFGLADRRRQELFLARDRFGEKPLLIAEDPRGVSFASELRPLAALPGLRRRMNARALASYLCLNYVGGDNTLMEGIRRLPPGTWRRYRAGGSIQSGKFFDPFAVATREEPTLQAALPELEHRLDRAVNLALRSDVPVGIFLSGGIDSGLLAASAVRSGRLSHAYCLTPAEKTYSEWDGARATAQQLGIPLTRVELSPAALGEFFEIVSHADDPLADSSAVAVWTLAREASRTNKVVLSGDGGDELFGGYLTYQATAVHTRVISRLPLAIRKQLAAAGLRLPTSERKVSASYKLMRFLRASDLPPTIAHLTWNGTWLPSQAAGLVRDADLKAFVSSALDDLAANYPLPFRPSLRDLQALDCSEYLPNDILSKADRMTMAHGLEARAPWLVPEVADFALGLPAALKCSPVGGTKRILRQLAQDRYRLAVARAPKQGFSIPVHAWLRGAGRHLVDDLLAPQSVRALEVLDEAAVRRVVEDHMSGRRSYGFELWGLMVLAAWHRARIARAPQLPPDQPPAPRLELTASGSAPSR